MLKNPQVTTLNKAQESAAHAPNGPLLIVAGAGTGKTRTLTNRIVHLIENGIAPRRICAITFTNKAAKEMADRVGTMKDGPFIGTFHSLGARILRKECRSFGRGPNFVIFDDHDSFELIKKIVKAMDAEKEISSVDDKKNKKEKSPAFFAGKISEIKNKGSAGEKDQAVLGAFEKYEAALHRNNAFDFDDLIEKPVALFRDRPEVLKKYQGMFDAVLVDEYQDINPKQNELVSLLAKGHKNISVVGDDEQTIYSWRYADVATFLGFDKEWKGANVFFLEENYRSTGVIIRAASSVVKNNRFRAPKNLWTRNPDGRMIQLYEAWGENEEAGWIVSNLWALRSEDKRSRIAILYRTNAQSRAVEQALLRANIPYRIWGGLKFYERREVKDIVAALRYAANEKDEVAKERLEKNVTKKRFAAFAGKLSGTAERSPTELVKLFLETVGYLEYLENHFINADEREENIAELVSFASEFKDLPELLERLSLLQAADEIAARKAGGEAGAGGGNEVNLMTIHLAKGLEFDSVFIAGASEGLLPHGRSLDREDSLEEERRLMYVAMTRARKNLFISFFGIPSRFIGEIPEDCIELASGAEALEEEVIELD